MHPIRIAVLLLTGLLSVSAQVVVPQPELCPETERSAGLILDESPVKIHFLGDANCFGFDDKGGLVRVWKYSQRYQRLAASKKWKVSVEKGDGDRSSYELPPNSIVGVVLQQKQSSGNKWKAYRGNSKNPVALTQPVILFTLRKATETKPGKLKEEHLVWDVMTVDPLSLDKAAKNGAGTFPIPSGAADLRVDEVWVWQGLNPIPKKVNIGTSKGKLTFVAE